MKAAIIVVAFISEVACGQAVTDMPQTSKARCEPIDYAEMEDMSQAALMGVFCDTQRLAAQHVEGASTLAKRLGRQWVPRREALEQYAAQCKEQAQRIGDIYARRFNVAAVCPK